MARVKRLQIRIGEVEEEAIRIAGERWPLEAGNRAELGRLIILDWRKYQPLWQQLERIERKLDRLLSRGNQ